MIYLSYRGGVFPVSKCKKCTKLYVVVRNGNDTRTPIDDFERTYVILKSETEEAALDELKALQKKVEKDLLLKVDEVIKCKDLALNLPVSENDIFYTKRIYFDPKDTNIETPITAIVCMSMDIRIYHTSFCDIIQCDKMRKYYKTSVLEELMGRIMKKISKKYLEDANAVLYKDRFTSTNYAYLSLKNFEFSDVTNTARYGPALEFKSTDGRARWTVSSSIFKSTGDSVNCIDNSYFSTSSAYFSVRMTYSDLKKYGIDSNKEIRDYYNKTHPIEFSKDKIRFIFLKLDSTSAYMYERYEKSNGTYRYEKSSIPRIFYQKGIDEFKKSAPIKLEFYEYAIYSEIDDFCEIFKIKNGRLEFVPEKDYWNGYKILEDIKDLKDIDDMLMKEIIKSLKRQLGDDLFNSIALIGEVGD